MEFVDYANITDIIEDDMDCLSIEALLAELFIEEETGIASYWEDA